ncbi:pentapeptide repeat-containing protein [Salinilacihabitans rarus]|uniref:pentapeptide repeat-containing protein n=1 Tax=Salinilacihabitans rarus TaxID=2961596 RepID=UPI0020C899D6|nr:pentapeptide repeat-containing protein [Salinilacihabitans rarus]
MQPELTRGNVGAVCCWRPRWGDGERCVWHADVESKPREAFEADRPRRGERLDGAILRSVSLAGVTWLAGCRLIGADFTGAILRGVDFTGADLRRSTFRDVDLRRATFERAVVEDALFVNADLREATFLDARLDRTLFSDAPMDRETAFGDRLVYERLIDEADDREAVIDFADGATWTYRELQRIFDENALPDRSIEYYRREMDLRRRVAWKTGAYRRAIKLAGSHWLMRYGTSPWRVVASSLVLILVCALLYPLTGGIREVGVDTAITYSLEDPTQASLAALLSVFFRSLYFSIVTFATLGYGDIQPIGTVARTIAGVESLLGSLLMALLVFVLTRSVR